MAYNNKSIYLNNLTGDIQSQINAISNTNVGVFTTNAAGGLSGTPITVNPTLYSTVDVMMSGNAYVSTPTNMVNGQYVNMLFSQDGYPYNWNVNFSAAYQFPSNIQVTPSSGQGSATVYTILMIRNTYFVSGIAGYLE